MLYEIIMKFWIARDKDVLILVLMEYALWEAKIVEIENFLEKS